MTPDQLENGYWQAYGRFYEWGNILKGAMTKESAGALRHIAYAGGWKKFEWVWHALIRMKQVALGLPLLERALDLTRPPRLAAKKFDEDHACGPAPAFVAQPRDSSSP